VRAHHSCHEPSLVGTAASLALRGLSPPYGTRQLFTEKSARRLPHIAAPIERQKSLPDVSMERTMRPIAGARHQPMSHRVEVNVIDMAREVGIVADRMFPETALPYAFFAFVKFASTPVRIGRQTAGEIVFDQAPATGEIGIVLWQSPNGV
jgi:hypothetical protein